MKFNNIVLNQSSRGNLVKSELIKNETTQNLRNQEKFVHIKKSCKIV